MCKILTSSFFRSFFSKKNKTERIGSVVIAVMRRTVDQIWWVFRLRKCPAMVTPKYQDVLLSDREVRGVDGHHGNKVYIHSHNNAQCSEQNPSVRQPVWCHGDVIPKCRPVLDLLPSSNIIWISVANQRLQSLGSEEALALSFHVICFQSGEEKEKKNC